MRVDRTSNNTKICAHQLLQRQQDPVDLAKLKDDIRKVFRHASVIGAGKSICIVYDCVEGDIIDEAIEGIPGEVSGLETFRKAFGQAKSVEFTFSSKNGKLRTNMMLTYDVREGGVEKISVSEPIERRALFSEILTNLRENPVRSNSGREPYRISKDLLCHPNDERYILKELEKIFEWIDAKAEKRTLVNLPAMARWKELCSLIEDVPGGLEVEVFKPRTIEDINSASAGWLFEGEGDYSHTIHVSAEHQKTFVRMLELSDEFVLEIGFNEGYSGISYVFGLYDIMV